MKKVFALLLAAVVGLAMSVNARAIEDQDPVGSITVGAHAMVFPGIGANLFGDYVLFDNWWKGHFTVGAQLGYSYYARTYDSSAFGYVITTNYHAHRFVLTPRVTYGLNILRQLEVHAGVMAGLGYENNGATIVSGTTAVPTETDPGPGVRFVFGEILGARYFLTETLAASLELNYANYMPWINVGVAYRF
jgi:hypothetical protein